VGDRPARADDPGASQERTTLAWRRTGLALVVGTLTIGRLALDHLGQGVLVPTALVAVLGMAVVVGAARARRLAGGRDGEPELSVLRDGRLPGIVASLLTVLALGELASGLVRIG
jgi:uncharacterized membrane protein YidH (DUF202 family)